MSPLMLEKLNLTSTRCVLCGIFAYSEFWQDISNLVGHGALSHQHPIINIFKYLENNNSIDEELSSSSL